jgi:hypothetical protein
MLKKLSINLILRHLFETVITLQKTNQNKS